MTLLNVKCTLFVQSVSISFISDLEISVESSPLLYILFNIKSVAYSKGTFVNKAFTSKETIWYPVGTSIVRILYIKSLVLETVNSQIPRGDISFDKYLARWYVAVSILEIVGRIDNFYILSSLESLWILTGHSCIT